jgi:hypothetical protein
VELTVEGTPRPLATSIDLSLYRIVQEALTNARKRSMPPPARATRARSASTATSSTPTSTSASGTKPPAKKKSKPLGSMTRRG